MTFQNNDVSPFGSDNTARAEDLARFRAALAETGLAVPMVTTNLFTHPVLKERVFTAHHL